MTENPIINTVYLKDTKLESDDVGLAGYELAA